MKAIKTLGRLLGVAAVSGRAARSTDHPFSNYQREETAMKIIGVIAAVLVGVGGAWAATIHVPDDQQTIQAGIDAAQDGDTILVAAGEYVENIDFNRKSISLIGNANSPSEVVINGNGREGSVVTISRGEREVTIQGFTIENGTGTLRGDYEGGAVIVGGGIIVWSNGMTNAIIENCIIQNNNIITDERYRAALGAGIFFRALGTIRNCVIRDNTARQRDGGGSGSAIGIYYSNDAVIQSCEIYGNNSSRNGGAITILHTHNLRIIDCNIHDNNCAGIYLERSNQFGNWETSDVRIEDCRIAQNARAGIECYLCSFFAIRTEFSLNSQGAIIAWYAETANLDHCRIIANGATPHGAVVYVDNTANVRFDHTEITRNESGACEFYSSNPILSFSTISENTGNEAAILIDGRSRVTLDNCVLWQNSPAQLKFSHNNDEAQMSIIVSYSNVENGQDGIVFQNNPEINWGEGNIDADPRFLDPDNGDFHLTRESPCIDAGDPDSDLDLDGTRADMGAFYAHQTFHRIPLRRGWNILSSFNPARVPDIRTVFSDIVSHEHLTLVKDQSGRFYIPANDFSNMEPWDVRQGYQAKLTERDTLVIVNIPTEVGTPIPLRQGWNIVAYFPEADIPAPEAFANLGDNLIIAKDEQGRFYIRANRFSNMGRLTRGKGYQVKAAAEGELVWNMGQRLAGSRTGIPACPDAMERQECLSYYPPVEATGGNMSVLIADCKLQIASCGEIGVFTKDGLCVGATSVGQAFLPVTTEGQTGMSVLQVTSEGQTGMSVLLGMAIWGDDPTTPETDGATEGEPLTFKLWDGTGESVVQPKWIEGDGKYSTDGFAQAEIQWSATGMSPLPTEFALSAPFPNPFNSTVRISFALPQASHARLALYDLSGRQVALLANAAYPVGYHSFTYAADGLPSGIYLIRGEFGGTTRLAKVTLLK